MMRMVLIVFVLIVFIPVLAFATPISYLATGTVTYEVNNQVIESDLQGFAVIDDEVEIHPGAHFFYHYEVMDFAMYTEYDYWAGTGDLALEEDSNEIAFRDGLMSNFVNARIDFQDEYSISYDRTDVDSWMTLAPQITMFADWFKNYNSYNPLYTNIVLTQVVPVPEPASFLLFGIGFTYFVGTRKRKRKMLFKV